MSTEAVEEQLQKLREDLARLHEDLARLASAAAAPPKSDAPPKPDATAKPGAAAEPADARERLRNAARKISEVSQFSQQGVETVVKQVSEHPLCAAAAAFGLGFAIGKLFGRR